jgi:transcription factor SFP1
MPSPPITIATPRQPSNSPPRNQQSNLTSQLRQPQPDHDMDMDGIPNNEPKGRQESVSMLSTTPYGAKAIPVRDGMGFRRESQVGLSGSLMGGMSWGGCRRTSAEHADGFLAAFGLVVGDAVHVHVVVGLWLAQL